MKRRVSEVFVDAHKTPDSAIYGLGGCIVLVVSGLALLSGIYSKVASVLRWSQQPVSGLDAFVSVSVCLLSFGTFLTSRGSKRPRPSLAFFHTAYFWHFLSKIWALLINEFPSAPRQRKHRTASLSAPGLNPEDD